MSTIPFHPQIVHLPLALSVLLPFLTLVVVACIQKQRFTFQVWLLVVGLQVLTTATGYLAMETGEDEEAVVEKVVGKKAIHEHEERAEMFVAFSVAASVLAIAAVVIKPALQVYLMATSLLLMLGQAGLAWRTGASGGELVYVHQAASAYQVSTPAPAPVEDGAEEHDYGADESNEEDEEREHDE
jgi:uncharacterized membrane protein